MFSVQDASHGAGQMRPVNSGKLLVECRLREASSQFAVVDEVVEVRDLVVDRAAGRAGLHRAGAVAIGDAAVHAARGLVARVLLAQRNDEFLEILHPLRDRRIFAVVTLDLKKTCSLTLVTLTPLQPVSSSS